MSQLDNLVSLDPQKPAWAIRLDLRNPMGIVTSSRWMPVPARWVAHEEARRSSDYRVMERQAISGGES